MWCFTPTNHHTAGKVDQAGHVAQRHRPGRIDAAPVEQHVGRIVEDRGYIQGARNSDPGAGKLAGERGGGGGGVAPDVGVCQVGEEEHGTPQEGGFVGDGACRGGEDCVEGEGREAGDALVQGVCGGVCASVVVGSGGTCVDEAAEVSEACFPLNQRRMIVYAS